MAGTNICRRFKGSKTTVAKPLDRYLLVPGITIVARLQAAFARGAGSNGWMNPSCMSYQKISIFVRSAFTLRPMAIPFPTPDPLFV